MAQDELDKFIEDILVAKNLSGMSDEVKMQLISDLKARLLDQINRALIEALPDDKLDEFNLLLDSGNVSDESLQQFIIQSGVNIQQVTAKTMLLFRDLYLQTSDQRKV